MSSVSDELAVAVDALDSTGTLLEQYLRMPVAKALDISTRDGFDRAVARLALRLRRLTRQSDRDAVREAVVALDVDWASVSASERARFVREALERAARALKTGASAVEMHLGPAARAVVAATRQGGRRKHRLSISADFNAVDLRVIEHLRTSETHVVRDAYGRRLEAFSRVARSTVADGLERGLGRSDIAAALEETARGTLTDRTGFYWETVAGAFTGRGRSYGLLSAFAEAGIERYRIEAVLDEATTPTCRFLHGKEFTVRAGLDAFARAEAEPEQLKQHAPWVREQRDPESGRRQLYVKRGDERLTLAEEMRSGLGVRDDVGEFQTRSRDVRLADASVFAPPFHGLCRSTLTTLA